MYEVSEVSGSIKGSLFFGNEETESCPIGLDLWSGRRKMAVCFNPGSCKSTCVARSLFRFMEELNART